MSRASFSLSERCSSRGPTSRCLCWWLIGRAGDILACWLKFECSCCWPTNTQTVFVFAQPPLPSFYMLKSSRWVSDLHTMRSDCSRVDLFAHQHSRKTKGCRLCQKRHAAGFVIIAGETISDINLSCLSALLAGWELVWLSLSRNTSTSQALLMLSWISSNQLILKQCQTPKITSHSNFYS